MKAAILKSLGSPLVIEDAPEPVLGTGEVVVDIVATRVLSYMNEVFSGTRNYALDLPIIPGPGGIGRVRAIGPDATKLPALATGCSAIRRCVRATTPCSARHCPARTPPPAGPRRPCACNSIFATVVRSSRCGCRRRTFKRLGTITPEDATRWCALGTPAGALWRFPCSQSSARRDRAGERRHRQFRQRGRLGRARDGRGLRGRPRPQRQDFGRPRPPLW